MTPLGERDEGGKERRAAASGRRIAAEIKQTCERAARARTATATSNSTLSLAAGVLPDYEPVEVVEAAAAAGFALVGIWFDPEGWSTRQGKEVRRRLDDTGLSVLDVEAVFISPEGDCGDRLIDAAAELDASNVLTVSRGLEVPKFAERFGQLCDRAAESAITVVVEPTRLYSIASIDAAERVLALAARPNSGILLDNLHLHRAGEAPDTARRLPPQQIPYAQLCDGPRRPDQETPRGLFDDARNKRMLLGEGELPIAEYLDSLPAGTPLSLEIRSRQLREDFPAAQDRAIRVFESSFDYLANRKASTT